MSPVPALDVYHHTLRELRSVLESLGLERHQHEITDVAAEVARQNAEYQNHDVA